MNNLRTEFNLYDILQNIAIGALACHSFVQGYSMVAKNKKNKSTFPKLEYLFYVLPIVYNKENMGNFKSSKELINAILKDKSIILGLQDRANKMSSQTFDALNLAFNKQLLSINDNNEITISEEMLKKKISIPASTNKENIVKNIQDTAKKLGNMFAKTDEKNIQLELNIRF
ncbi:MULTISPECIES: three component ABC system middle component [unclassified Empedobacter]|uniref:three component ABC system middle component n=1 Tax=unclassified Empedobacter TaxID=2643773 RepID=UPI0025C4B641|nr:MULTISPECIES: three component ABC system middle component [unclassified Empedobacter]